MLAKRALLSFQNFFRLHEDTNLLQFFQTVPLEMINLFQCDRGAVVMVVTVAHGTKLTKRNVGHRMLVNATWRGEKAGEGWGLCGAVEGAGYPHLRALMLC